MGLMSMFRSRPPIRATAELAQFIEENAAFVAQKGIYEYSRARAGHYAKVLFREPTFLASVERSRWLAFPLGLAMVGELAEGVLRPHGGPDPVPQQQALRALVVKILDGYPLPSALTVEEWAAERGELDRRLQLVGLHPPKRSFEIPEPYARIYFDLMPIHESLRGRDFPTMRNYLKLTLCHMHEKLVQQADLPAIADALRAPAA